jgi:hypothetical protein
MAVPTESGVSVRSTHLPNSRIKGDGVSVFLSGRDHRYRQDLHAPTKLLPETVQSPVVQECLQPGASISSVAINYGINANVIRKWTPLYRDQPEATSLPAFVPLKAAPKRPAEVSVIIELPMAGQVITVKWSTSDPEGCTQFIRAVAR